MINPRHDCSTHYFRILRQRGCQCLSGIGRRQWSHAHEGQADQSGHRRCGFFEIGDEAAQIARLFSQRERPFGFAVGVAIGVAGGEAQDDPVWRLPLFDGYREWLKSDIADLNNAPAGGFAGATTAALFLDRFVGEGIDWAHFDTFAWRPTAKAGRPKGGEALGLRLMAINASSVVMPLLFGTAGALIGVGGVFWIVGGLVGAGARAAWGLRPPSHRG